MPVKSDVDAIKDTGIGHVNLADQSFLSRRAEKFDGTRDVTGIHHAFQRNRGARRACPKQVVAAAMSMRMTVVTRLLQRDNRITNVRQRIVFGENADDRPAVLI